MQIGLILVGLAFPLLELAVLIKVGQTIGLWWTVLLLLAAAVGGGLIVQHQGLSAAQRAAQSIARGRPPIEPVADSLMLMLAGVLLVIPGLITDVAGLALLVPWVRRGVARWALARLLGGAEVEVEPHDWRSPGRERPPPGAGPRRMPDGGIVIEGEWRRVDPEPGAQPQPGPQRDGKPADGKDRRR